MDVLLASTSPARLMLMRQAGIEPTLLAPGTDEDAVVADAERAAGRPLEPFAHVELLARRKAADAAALLAAGGNRFDGIVIGGDSMFALDGDVHGKPHTAERATERWRQMRGHRGELFSGLCVLRVDEHGVLAERHEVSVAGVRFAADVDDTEIADYVASGEPLEVAGAFTLDSLAAAFIDEIDGDPSTVVGMSLPSLRRLVRSLGIAWTALWTPSG